jgi:tRNA-specific 2-thiouridylase
MSGGVDSSVAAHLLLEQGHEVIGVFMRHGEQAVTACAVGDEPSPLLPLYEQRADHKQGCCSAQDAEDARRVADRLSIPFYALDLQAEFRQIIDYFVDEYSSGRTPNPCVMCNEKLKFGTLISRARKLGAEKIATGHFARIERDASTGRYLLKRGRDPRKDQSYFLFSLKQEQLARTIFPLGELTKSETREIAHDCQLKTADKEESMEICFVPDKDYGKFLEESRLAQRHRGDVVDVHGHKLGEHDGIEFYTIGQRKGLGIAAAKPLYVIDLDPANNRVIVGDESLLAAEEFTVERCNWIPFEEPPSVLEVTAKIRYNHPGTPAVIRPQLGGGAQVRLSTPQRAITPGQACVFYQEDLVVGGGWICRK